MVVKSTPHFLFWWNSHVIWLMTWRTSQGRCMAFSRSLAEIFEECVWMSGCSKCRLTRIFFCWHVEGAKIPRKFSLLCFSCLICIYIYIYSTYNHILQCFFIMICIYIYIHIIFTLWRFCHGTWGHFFHWTGTWSRRSLEWSAVFHPWLGLAASTVNISWWRWWWLPI